MKIAVTNHAVQRFQERVEGARDFNDESVRRLIRSLVKEGFRSGAVRPHPYEAVRRVIPFSSGKSVLYLSVGPNTTTFKAALSVIGVLFEKEVTGGRQGMGVVLGDQLQVIPAAIKQRPQFLAIVDGDNDVYKIADENELIPFLEKRSKEGDVSVYELSDEEDS